MMSCCYCCLLSLHQLFVTPWTVALQAPLSMGFPRKEHSSGLPFPYPGIFPTQGSKLFLLHWQGGFFYGWATWEAPHDEWILQILHVYVKLLAGSLKHIKLLQVYVSLFSHSIFMWKTPHSLQNSVQNSTPSLKFLKLFSSRWKTLKDTSIELLVYVRKLNIGLPSEPATHSQVQKSENIHCHQNM